MPRDTRDRILVAAKRMFNEQRFGNVTIAALAKEVGIAEGNLWYHFKNKRVLLEALTEQFIVHLERRLSILPTHKGNVLGEFAFLLLECAHEIREFRFLYRDQADYGEHTDVLLRELPEIYRRTIGQFQQFFEAMIRKGDLDWPHNQADQLASNVVIILRYNLEYMRERGLDESGAVHASLHQQLTLYENRMRQEAAEQLRLYLSPDETHWPEPAAGQA
ncbi:MAG: TetR/AcrR family transcriptional regulator [Alphaproteobacteria bacterium]